MENTYFRKVEGLTIERMILIVIRWIFDLTGMFGFLLTIGSVGTSDLISEGVASRYTDGQLYLFAFIGIAIITVCFVISNKLSKHIRRIERHLRHLMNEDIVEITRI